jgi:hypothetical protein
MDLIKNPIVLAAAAGLLVALVVQLNAWSNQRSLKEEIERLKKHLHDKMAIDEKGNAAIIGENSKLTEQVNKLKTTLEVLSHKPSKSELRSLVVLEEGIHLMSLNVPGFTAHWEAFKIQADAKLEKIMLGEMIWPRHFIRKTLGRLGIGHNDVSLSVPQVTSNFEVLEDAKSPR